VFFSNHLVAKVMHDTAYHAIT